MKYFVNVTSLEELRKQYRRLAKINHPDMGGSAEEMKIINIEYEIQFKSLENSDTVANGIKYNKEQDAAIRGVINIIIHLNVEIEVCGSWVWVTGNTYACKDELKKNGFR